MAAAQAIVNVLRLLKRDGNRPPVSSEDVCAILVAPLVLPPHKAWFQECESYGALRGEGRAAVMGAIEHLLRQGLLAASATGALSLNASNLHLLSSAAPAPGGGGGGGGGAEQQPSRKRPLVEFLASEGAAAAAAGGRAPLGQVSNASGARGVWSTQASQDDGPVGPFVGAACSSSSSSSSGPFLAPRPLAPPLSAQPPQQSQPQQQQQQHQQPRPGASSSSSNSSSSAAPYAAPQLQPRPAAAQAAGGAGAAPAAPAALEANGLTSEQNAVRQLAQAGRSLFFTGSAGTGKSYLLRLVISDLKEQHGEASVAVTAPTGVAACNVGGSTLNSFAGIGLGTEPADKLYATVNRNERARARWRDCKVLVVDEVSMLDGGMFDKLDYLARRVRGNERAFGGIQLVLAGDFFQLPPVGLTNTRGGGGGGGGWQQQQQQQQQPPITFAFEAAAWRRALYAQVTLTRVFRQRDGAFVALLNEFRRGVVSEGALRALAGAGSAVSAAERGGAKPTTIFARNRQVDETNCRELERCPGEAREFQAADSGAPAAVEQLRNNCHAITTLRLKARAQVMLLKNIDTERGLVNGARGVVEGFPEEGGVRVRFPRRRADGSLASSSGGGGGGGGGGGEEDTFVEHIQPTEWTLEQMGEVVATRRQVPLKLAYALSIHKSQVRARPPSPPSLPAAASAHATHSLHLLHLRSPTLHCAHPGHDH